jgi:single-strand DNA-binding protein
MLNRVILHGNVGNAPQFKKTQEGKDMISFSLATSFTWKGSDGEWNKHVDWHKVSVSKASTVRWLKDLLKKGDAVYLEGALRTFEKKNKNGLRRMETHVVVTDREGLVEHIRSANRTPLNQNLDHQNQNSIPEITSQPEEGQSL